MRNRIFKFPAKAKTTVYLLTATGFAYQAVDSNFLSHSSDSLPISSHFPEKIRTGIDGVVRSFRAISTITFTVVDYKYSLHGLPVDSDEYRRKLSETHLRSAKRILKLCEANKGFYAKAGQFVAALRQAPKEYTSTLSSLQDQAVPCHFKAIKEVLVSNFGRDLSEIFLSFDEQPIAAASIAQVHHAVLKCHQEVAIKVQYPGLEQQMNVDTKTMSVLSKSIAWIFPEYRFEWLASEFAGATALELDFIQEARNSERTAKNLRDNKVIRVPHVFWELTTSQVLTMQFCGGHKVDDVDFMNQMGINPIKVVKALIEVFAEMIFVHGFVHGDPHPGNILISPEGQNGFSLVLLDHGIYKQLDEGFRQDYCQLWKALILLDSNKILHLGERFGVGKHARYFPLIFTGRTIDSKSALGGGMSEEEKRNIKQELKSLKMNDISMFMESLPPDFLMILRIDGLLRSVIRKLGVPQQVRMLAYAKYAVYGLSPKLDLESDFAVKVVFSRLLMNMNYLKLRLIIGVFEAILALQKFKDILCTLYIKINGTFWGIMLDPTGKGLNIT
ncbi:Protein kinase superfamily protein [Quillaja saponaria]|uniref:Protein kinase superfamily protein n=1 Tax=Quillaja saponaria TaxID=32244 RepID=A0AAD7LVZ8_QUISA|nr:Protein kinase superfamily protein [Quillaja saponaria]